MNYHDKFRKNKNHIHKRVIEIMNNKHVDIAWISSRVVEIFNRQWYRLEPTLQCCETIKDNYIPSFRDFSLYDDPFCLGIMLS